MVIVENTSSNILEVCPKGSLEAKDFDKLGEIADKLIDQYGNIKVLINASNFEGWSNILAAEKHFQFVKSHHKKALKIAIITDHLWQELLATLLKTFVHPDVRIFKIKEIDSARKWINEKNDLI